ncbi:hypothetical protein KIN20_014417 [Parelaphostrongylus tenuis]|uniref:Uncharacterized protein n=1 Tax=Parelaphostrongylus tenuis TaxID=148309 RepID=A0AAD5MH57_PARTN|nr:hypothetical protein KIN20_014417 [Parelaphostrongylus tenuis]
MENTVHCCTEYLRKRSPVLSHKVATTVMEPERTKRKKKFNRSHQTKTCEQHRIEFHSDENREYDVPVDANNQSPIPTLSSCSIPSASRYLDEIALLKRGKITRDTPKHTYMRGKSKEKVENPQEEPITIAELNTRGLKVSDNHIIYCIPNDTQLQELKSDVSHQSESYSSQSTSSGTNDSRSEKDVKEYDVGSPNENSKLRITVNAHNDRSYQLSTGNNYCILKQNPKRVVLVTWKN